LANTVDMASLDVDCGDDGVKVILSHVGGEN